MSATTEIDILRGARELLARPYGWTQRRFRSPLGAVCLLGAIRQAAGYYERGPYQNFDRDLAQDRLIERACVPVRACLPSDGGLTTWTLTAYNDQDDMTQERILQLVDCAIEGISK